MHNTVPDWSQQEDLNEHLERYDKKKLNICICGSVLQEDEATCQDCACDERRENDDRNM